MVLDSDEAYPGQARCFGVSAAVTDSLYTNLEFNLFFDSMKNVPAVPHFSPYEQLRTRAMLDPRAR